VPVLPPPKVTSPSSPSACVCCRESRLRLAGERVRGELVNGKRLCASRGCEQILVISTAESGLCPHPHNEQPSARCFVSCVGLRGLETTVGSFCSPTARTGSGGKDANLKNEHPASLLDNREENKGSSLGGLGQSSKFFLKAANVYKR